MEETNGSVGKVVKWEWIGETWEQIQWDITWVTTRSKKESDYVDDIKWST